MRFRIFIGKWIYIIGFCFFVSCTSTSETPVNTGPDPLDAAIREISDYLNERLDPDIKLVFLNFQSDSPTLSEYIIEGLIENTVNDNLFTVVDRQNLALIQQEMHFQLSGEVSDESAQAIGKLLGAQTIVSGAVSQMGNSYRMRLRAINVETAEIQGQLSRDIIDSQRITFLLENYGTPLSESVYPSGSVANSGIANSGQAAPTGNRQSNQTEEPVVLPSNTTLSPASLPVIHDSALPYEQFTVLRSLDATYTKAIAVSPDGKYVIVNANNTIKLYDTETGNIIRNVDIPSFHVIAFSPDSKRVITNNNHNIRITDIESGAFRDCTGHTQAIRSLAYSPDGRFFVSSASTNMTSGSSDNTIRIWNADTGQEVMEISGHTNYVLSAVYSPDGRTIASFDGDGTVKFWNVETGMEVRSISVAASTHNNPPPHQLAYSSDGSKIAVAIWRRIIIYDTLNGKELFNLTGHASNITGMRFNPEGNRLLSVSGGQEKNFYVWNMSSGWGTENKLSVGNRGYYGLDLSADGTILVMGTGYGTTSRVRILGIE